MGHVKIKHVLQMSSYSLFPSWICETGLHLLSTKLLPRSCFPGWWKKGIDFIRLFDSTPITLCDQKSFSFAVSNFSYTVQLQLSSFTSPVCSSSQCSLEIFVIVKETDLVRQDIFPLWALWYIKVLSVWHLYFALWFFPIFLFCTYAIIIILVEWFLTAK